MMVEVERVKLKKIYVWRATLFGLLVGSIVGLILAIITFLFGTLLASTSIGLVSFGGQAIGHLLAGSAASIAVAVLFSIAFSGAASCFVGSILYNISASFGAKLHFDFMSYENDPAPKMI